MLTLNMIIGGLSQVTDAERGRISNQKLVYPHESVLESGPLLGKGTAIGGQ